MDYKEKYENALKRAKDIRFGNPNSATANVVCEEIFPELAESDDEKIRKEILSIVKSYRENCITEGNHRFDDCIAWLEKQGEKKPANYSVWVGGIEVNDNYLTKEEAEKLADKYRKDSYEDVAIEKIEQKPAWSEEDEGELYLTISLLDKLKEEAYTIDCENCINWLKSRKPQPRWKPTQEQIHALSMAYKDSLTSGENLITQTEMLKSLYNDLKKL